MAPNLNDIYMKTASSLCVWMRQRWHLKDLALKKLPIVSNLDASQPSLLLHHFLPFLKSNVPFIPLPSFTSYHVPYLPPKHLLDFQPPRAVRWKASVEGVEYGTIVLKCGCNSSLQSQVVVLGFLLGHHNNARVRASDKPQKVLQCSPATIDVIIIQSLVQLENAIHSYTLILLDMKHP
ncbi:hypothetical protein SDJN02_23245, partial [Cucurbita argyrosperma subsp. argyrosperma]